MHTKIGFVGLGDMGRPMATCLAKAGLAPVVWARNPASAEAVLMHGTTLADSIDALCAECGVIVLMLADGAAMDEVFGRGTSVFADRVKGRTLVHMGTTPPSYSKGLEVDILAAGGRYVEMPVSGSSGPAAEGRLVAMAAGDPTDIEAVLPLVDPMVSGVVRCGAVPKATQMKLAVNTYLMGMMLGLMEATNYAEAAELDFETLRGVLEASPMSNDLMRMKLPKIQAKDFAPQGSIRQAVNNGVMACDAGAEVGAPMASVEAFRDLAREAKAAGLGDEDMIAITKMLAARRSSP